MSLSLNLSAEDLLRRRLALLGFPPDQLRTHANRSVMVSFSPRTGARVHRGYAYAPDRVLRAIVRFLSPRVAREARRAAKRELLAFPVDEFVPSRPRRVATDRSRPGDIALLDRLEMLHAELNERHFDGALSPIPVRLSPRMRTRLGELAIDHRTSRPTEIALSRRHIHRDPWGEVAHTLLHEMIHQWQAESGLPVNHGPLFRRKAREVGVNPKAIADVGALERNSSSWKRGDHGGAYILPASSRSNRGLPRSGAKFGSIRSQPGESQYGTVSSGSSRSSACSGSPTSR